MDVYVLSNVNKWVLFSSQKLEIDGTREAGVKASKTADA